MLLYLDSTDDVPEHEDDRLHVRDNVKLAQVRQRHVLSVIWLTKKCFQFFFTEFHVFWNTQVWEEVYVLIRCIVSVTFIRVACVKLYHSRTKFERDATSHRKREVIQTGGSICGIRSFYYIPFFITFLIV